MRLRKLLHVFLFYIVLTTMIFVLPQNCSSAPLVVSKKRVLSDSRRSSRFSIPSSLRNIQNNSHPPTIAEIRLCITTTQEFARLLEYQVRSIRKANINPSKRITHRWEQLTELQAELNSIARCLRGRSNVFLNAHSEFIYPERPLALDKLLISHKLLQQSIEAGKSHEVYNSLNLMNSAQKKSEQALNIIDRRSKTSKRKAKKGTSVNNESFNVCPK